MRGGTPINACLGLGLALLTACHLPAADKAGSRLYAPADLPSAVARTRQALLAAAQSGDLKRLRPIMAGAEHFRFSYAVEPDPVAYWRDIRAQLGGRPVLRALAQALALPAARTNEGMIRVSLPCPHPRAGLRPTRCRNCRRCQPPDDAATLERACNGGELHRLPGVDRGRRYLDRLHLRRLKKVLA